MAFGNNDTYRELLRQGESAGSRAAQASIGAAEAFKPGDLIRDFSSKMTDRRNQRLKEEDIAENKRRYENEESRRKAKDLRIKKQDDSKYATQEATKLALDPKGYTRNQVNKELAGIADSRRGLVESGASDLELARFDKNIESQYGSGDALYKRRAGEIESSTYGREGVDAGSILDIRSKLEANKRADDAARLNEDKFNLSKRLTNAQLSEIERKNKEYQDKKLKEEALLKNKNLLAERLLNTDTTKDVVSSNITDKSRNEILGLNKELVDAKKIKASQDQFNLPDGTLEKQTKHYNSVYNYLINTDKGDGKMSPEDAHKEALRQSGLGKTSQDIALQSKKVDVDALQKRLDNYKAKYEDTTKKVDKTPTELKRDKIKIIKESKLDASDKLNLINEVNKPLSLEERKFAETVRNNKEKNEISRKKYEAFSKKGKYKGSEQTLAALGDTDVDAELVPKFLNIKKEMNLGDKEFAEMVKNADYGVPWYGAMTDESQYDKLKRMIGLYKLDK